jgi:hypothetical protein
MVAKARRFAADNLAAIVGALSFAAYGWSVLAGKFDKLIGFSDWDQWYESQWVAYRTIFTYHEFPFWDPYRCGGMPLLAHPESHFLSPLFLLTIAFGPIAGLKMELPIYMAICWSGGYVLGRVLGMRPLAALAPATLFVSGSWLYEKAVMGQMSIVTFAYLPWILAAAWRANQETNFRHAVLGSLVLGLVFLEGGPYPLMFIVTVLGVLTLASMVTERTLRPMLTLAIVVAGAVGFSAVKFLPSWIFAHQNPRPSPDTQFNTLDILRRVLFSRNQNPLQGLDNGNGFWESGAYIGPFVVPAVLALMTPRRSAVWIFGAVIVLLLSQGDAGWLWPLVHKLPLYSSLRIPARFLIAFTLLIGVLAGFGIDWLCSLQGRLGAAIAVFLLGVCSYQTIRVGPPLISQVINSQRSPRPPADRFSQIWLGPQGNQMTLAAMENHGVVGCYGYQPAFISSAASDRNGYKGEQYLAGAGNSSLINWSPDALTYKVDVPAETSLVINQNYDSGWRVARGSPGIVTSYRGLLAVHVQRGSEEIRLEYLPVSIVFGAIVSLLTVAGSILLCRYWR